MKLKLLLEKIKVNEFLGDKDIEVNNIVSHNDKISANDIFWVNDKNKEKLKNIDLGTVICSSGSLPDNKNCNYIIVDEPRRTFQEVLNILYPDKIDYIIHPSASIAKSAKLSDKCFIGANVVIEDEVKISDGAIIDCNTVLKRKTIVGRNVKIGANCTIGGVGFGYEKNEDGIWEQIKHIGNVVLEENVEIGNNTTIDRAVLGSTVLGKFTKVDNLVHIAHGVKIGENSMIIANSMIAGSVTIGDNTWIAPSSSILNQKKIGSDVVVGLGAVVLKDVEDKQIIIGNPGKPLEKKS